MQLIKQLALELGFQDVGITDCDLSSYCAPVIASIERGYHADMHFLKRNLEKRLNPKLIMPSVESIICVYASYKAVGAEIASYASGQDYHIWMKEKLEKLSEKIAAIIGHFNYHIYCDNATILEKALATKAGLGWIGKNTLLIHPEKGSFGFLGEILTDLKLPTTNKQPYSRCGSCRLCVDCCPTRALDDPYMLNATKCIAYLTIEHKGEIPKDLRNKIGTSVVGCDRCQLICPWNNHLITKDNPSFNFDPITALKWSERKFLQFAKHSAINRLSHEKWKRNLAIALGNAPQSLSIIKALEHELCAKNSPLVKEHIAWALEKQKQHKNSNF